MAQDKRIGVSIDDSGISKLRQSANELARDMIRSSRAYSTSSREVLKDIEEQIRLIEKRNRLEEEGQRTALLRQRQAGKIDQPEYEQRLRQISVSSREDKLQVELLRELIDTIKANAKEEIRENRQFVERAIRRDKSIEQLGVTGDPEEALKRTIQRGLLGEVGEAETEERRKFRDFGRSVGAGTNRALATVAGSPNEFYMVAAALSMIPIVGQGLSAITNRFVSSADTFGKSLGRLAALRGTSIGSERQIYGGGDASYLFSTMGLSPAEAVQKVEQYQRASAISLGGYDILNLMAAERSFGLSQSSLGNLAGISRYNRSVGISTAGFDSRDYIASNVIEVLRRSSDDNNAILQELLNTFNQTSDRLLSISGSVNMGNVASMISAIKEVTGYEGIQLDRAVGGIQGLSQSQNPVVRTLMARAFRQAMPDASWFEIRSAMERPLENPRALSNVFKSLEEMTGGGELYQNALYAMFGGQLSVTDILQLSKTNKLSDLYKQFADRNMVYTGVDYTGQTEGRVWKGEEATKRLEAAMQNYGVQIVNMTEKLINGVDDLASKVFGGTSDNITDYTKLETAVARGVAKGIKQAERM